MPVPSPTPLFREGHYLTYPHSNGFCQDGHSIVLGRQEGGTASLWRTSLQHEADSRICGFDVASFGEKLLWFDVARNIDRLSVCAGNELWIYDLDSPKNNECIYRAEAPAQLFSLSSISADGQRVLVGLKFPDRHAALLIEIGTGKSRILFEKSWSANHYHFSPHDEAWIGFCHEGLCDTVSDRVWGWHATEAPEGRCLLDHQWGDPAREIYIGHERWCFSATTVLAVAYGVSPGSPRGIYECGPDQPQRLVVEGDRHWHVNVSRSGRFIAIDTTGPHDLPGRGWTDSNNISDVLLLDRQSGDLWCIARSRLDSHPSHPHPTFSRDEKTILFNEAIAEPKGNRVRLVKNPFLFDRGSAEKLVPPF